MASPRSPMHQRRRLSRDSQRRDPHSPQERKEQQRAANVRWMREWQPVDPRMATVFLTWKRDVWGTRCITAHMVRTYRNARARNALYVALRQWLGSTCVGNAHREPLPLSSTLARSCAELRSFPAPLRYRGHARLARMCGPALRRPSLPASRCLGVCLTCLCARAAGVLVRRALAKMANRQAAAAIAAWAEMADAAKERRIKVRRALVRMLHRAMAGAFDGWAGHVAERRRKRVAASRCVRRMLMRSVARAFRAWCELRLRMLRVRKTMRVMANHRASMAFNSWLDFLVSLEERDNLMIRVIKKIALSTQAAAFEQWRCTVKEARRQERVLIRALGKMFHRVLAQAFEAWGEKVAALHRQRGVSNRAIAKMTHRALSMAFEVRDSPSLS